MRLSFSRPEQNRDAECLIGGVGERSSAASGTVHLARWAEASRLGDVREAGEIFRLRRAQSQRSGGGAAWKLSRGF